jgi:hypothetical protein
MEIDHRKLGEYFASLLDEELLETKRADLTEVAQGVYDLEISRRGLGKASATQRMVERIEASLDGRNDRSDDETADPDWHQNGVLVCSMMDQPGSNSAERISKAQTALQAAGIPSHLSVKRYPDDLYDSMELVAPVRYAMHAAGILDRDLFNDEFETYWRDHLAMLSDEDLRMLDPDIFCVGLLDKLARMKKIYAGEMKKRNLRA